MSQGPSLIFDKSSLESLNIHEAALMDNFYMSTITPLFFVECLADLEKQLKSGSTPEQLVGSLADRTPDSQGYPNVHHMAILTGELTREFDIKTVYERVAMAHGEPVGFGPEVDRGTRWPRGYRHWPLCVARQNMGRENPGKR
jgi:hypothetical protein